MGGESAYVVDLAASDDETHRDRLRGVSRMPALGTVRGVESLGTRQVYVNPWMTVREDEIQRADGSSGIYGVVDKPDFALIIPLDGERVRLVEQFRYPIGLRRWEFPQGTAPDRADSDPLKLAARELREETGLRAGKMIELGLLDVAPGMSSQRGRVFLATQLTEGFHEREHEEQDMRSAWFPRADFESMIAKGEITDAQSIAAYTLLLLHEHSQP
jgi:8-oxo-dGTP pyrophosphatase MutT (NUDIX family)